MQAIAQDSSNADICKGKHDNKQSISSGNHDLPQKPVRPLTAYQIFFRIEREYIVQTAAGEVADESVRDDGVCLSDVPGRYKNVKLSPDWHAGPGKRQKREHRERRGRIGFLELSRAISARWAELERIDPETKLFVQAIAKRQAEEYRRDVERYRELTKDLFLPRGGKSASHPAAPKSEAKKRSGENNSPRMNPSPLAAPLRGTTFSSDQPCDFMPCSYELEKDIDEFLSSISSNARHLLPPMPVLVEDRAVREMFQQEDDLSPSS